VVFGFNFNLKETKMGGATISLNFTNFITIGLIAMLFAWVVKWAMAKFGK
jgi:hypothetical protein